MTAHAAETVEFIRESLCVTGPNVLEAEIERAYGHLRQCFGLELGEFDLESIELWARLLADCAAAVCRRHQRAGGEA